MCFEADVNGPLLGAPVSPQTADAGFAFAPQASLYPERRLGLRRLRSRRSCGLTASTTSTPTPPIRTPWSLTPSRSPRARLRAPAGCHERTGSPRRDRRTAYRLERRDIVALVGLVVAAIAIPLGLAAYGRSHRSPEQRRLGVHARRHRVSTKRVRSARSDTRPRSSGSSAWCSRSCGCPAGQPWAFTAFGLVMAGLGIACTYLLARRIVGIGSAVMVVLLVLAFPGFARSSASFMTDVPTYALDDALPAAGNEVG